MTPVLRSRLLRLPREVDLLATLGPLRFGNDPSWAAPARNVLVKASLTPDGPGVEVLTWTRSTGEVRQEASGAGANWLCSRLPQLVGEADDPGDFEPPEQLRRAWRQHQGLRVPRSELVHESLVPIVLGQKVTGREASASYRRLVLAYGEPIGLGPWSELMVSPSAATWRGIPSWEWHRAGVGPERSQTIIRAMGRADALENLVNRPAVEARKAMTSLPGIGAWTAAEVAQRVLGDADAVSVGDFHVAKSIVYALTGERDGSDTQMVELLRPFVGHRFRIQRLVELGGLGQPRRGPRYQGLDHRHR